MALAKLKTLRKEKGFSQQSIASIMGTTPSNYSRKERGEVKIYEDEWRKLAKILDVEPNFLKLIH